MSEWVVGSDWAPSQPEATAIHDENHQLTGDSRQGNESTLCYQCGKGGHLRRECPNVSEEQRITSSSAGGCFNCGQEGHNKIDCPLPRVFSGTCRLCNQEGHLAKECPSKPPQTCRNCEETGHLAAECTKNRKQNFSGVESVTSEAAWEKMKQASSDRDLDDFRDAFREYVKSNPEVSYPVLERAFRKSGMAFFIIALAKQVDDVYTVMNLQGQLGMKYVVGFFFSPKCQRRSLQNIWPPSEEENLQRLEDAGVVVDAFVIKCRRCKQLGHSTASCQQEPVERAANEIVCTNCEKPGHRMRDCPDPRPDRYACRNCNERGHESKECPQPPNPANVTCKNCEKKGHFARDCPDRTPQLCNNCGEAGHLAKECEVVKCRNCDAIGHVSKECPKPRDYSRVKCNNCGQLGHTRVRCKEPLQDDGPGGGGDFESSATFETAADETGFEQWVTQDCVPEAAADAAATTTTINDPDSSGW